VRPRLASRFEPPSLSAAPPSGFARDAELTTADAFLEPSSSHPSDAPKSNFQQPAAERLTKPAPDAPAQLPEGRDEDKRARRQQQPDESTPRPDATPLERNLQWIAPPSSSASKESQPRQMNVNASSSSESRVEQGEARSSVREQATAEGVRVSESERLFDDAGLRRLEERVHRNEAAQLERQQQAEAAPVVAAAPQDSGPRSIVAQAAQKPQALAMPVEVASESPSINVTIGRIDVRAVMPQTPAPVRASARPRPALSLEDYLKQREGGPR
jgi:hypothetical protein